jgi:hypothetical protein
MTDEIIKQGIAKMYYSMSRACKRHSRAIEENIEEFNISDLKMGYELVDEEKNIKYQLVLELKKVE